MTQLVEGFNRVPDVGLQVLGPTETLRVAAKDLILEFSEYDLNRIVADQVEIRKYNPQRYEMEQLDAVVYVNPERKIVVGYKDISRHEFWVRGHMPFAPLMPGVIMCEAAAQLASYFTQKLDLLGAQMVGFGGMEDVRFRDAVVPGDRLVIVCQLLKVRRGAMIVCRFQGFVRENLVVQGEIKGVPIPLGSLPGIPFEPPVSPPPPGWRP
ncbi:MAG TPA: 3-hydroxyacyl-ACP dehydratase FabZ family protein [Pirellulales bacterium]|nr:3-hydroxyacyl-ACP dehydratase FabZ family protein [Pirellulales bacterium]